MLNEILADREATHGPFKDVADLSQAAKRLFHQGANWKRLTVVQRESLEMIASKIGRILSGDPHEVDHWRDIAGYAELAAQWLNAYTAAECDPTDRHEAGIRAKPVPAQAASASIGRATLP